MRDRIARLERQNRHLRTGVIVALLLPVLLVCLMGAGTTVRTNRITIVGSTLSFVTDSGRLLAKLELVQHPFNANADWAALRLYGRNGSKTSPYVWLQALEGGGSISIQGADGTERSSMTQKGFGVMFRPIGQRKGYSVAYMGGDKNGGRVTLRRPTDAAVIAELP